MPSVPVTRIGWLSRPDVDRADRKRQVRALQLLDTVAAVSLCFASFAGSKTMRTLFSASLAIVASPTPATPLSAGSMVSWTAARSSTSEPAPVTASLRIGAEPKLMRLTCGA